MYLSTFSCASLSGVGVGAALRATLHHLDGIPGFQGCKTLRNVTCSCKSSLEKSRSLGLYRYFLGKEVSLVFACLEVFCEHVTPLPTGSARHSNQLFTLRFQRSRSVGCRRSASWHDPSASDDRKGTTKNCCKKHKWNGFLRYMNVLSNCHLYNIPVYILIYVIIVFILFNRFSSTSSWCGAFKDLAFFSALATFGRVHWTLLTAMSKKAPENTKNGRSLLTRL